MTAGLDWLFVVLICCPALIALLICVYVSRHFRG